MPPTVVINSLQAVRRRVKLLSAVYGAGIVLAGLVSLLLATVLVDYALNLAAVPRLLLILAALAVVGYAAIRWLIMPMLARLSLGDVAGRLEQAFPQFNDRLRSTVDFIRTDVPGSQAMKQRVVDEAAALAGRLNLNSAVVARPAWYAVGAGSAAVIVVMLLALLVPQYASIAFSRLLTPFDAKAWPKRVQIDLLGSVPTRVPVGQRIDVAIELARGDSPSRKASIFFQYDGGAVQQRLMRRGEDGTYAAAIDARMEGGKAAVNLNIWMQAGDDRLPLPPVTVVPRLAIKAVEAQLTPPPYVTAQQPVTVNLAAAPAIVAEGSRVALNVTFNKHLATDAAVEVIPTAANSAGPQTQWTRVSDIVVSGTWTAQQSMRFHIRATDVDAFTNNALEEFEVVVRPDQTPTVQIENPRRNEERTAVSVVPLVGVAEDDFGIESLKLVAERTADKKRWEIDLLASGSDSSGGSVVRSENVADRVRLRASYSWDLAQLADANLKSGDVLEYHLLAKDNFALDGKSHEAVASGRLRITIVTQEELAARIIDELRQVKQLVTGVKAAMDRTRQETDTLADESKDKPQLDQADHTALERLTNQQATAASQTKQIAGKVEALGSRLAENKSPSQELNQITRDVAADLDHAAENPMKDATAQLSAANQPVATPQKRSESFADASQSQQRAAEELQRALDRMDNIGSLQQTIERLKQILAEQQKISQETRDVGKQNLGKTPEQMKPEDRQRLEAAADAQAKLAEQTNKALAEMQKLAEQMAKSDAAASQAMSRAAATAQQQQVSQNQQKAAGAAKQNQQSQAQTAQRQAELGLELMLNELREAERHKLAELQKRLEELQNLIANLVRRQAGHNLDNIAVQGPAKLASMDLTVIGELMLKAEREQGKLPPIPAIAQLSPSQEQTERNARDVAKSAEAMPNGAEPASHLTRAAGRMERAIVSLREKKLPEAYDPPQVEALVELEAAKRIVDAQKAAVDEQLEQQDKEAIREKYVKIKAEQEKLKDETQRIDKSRAADGALGRIDAVRLGQLPGEQGKLSDRTNQITQDLASLGSVVYIWANKDIVDSMNDVRQDLGKQATGVPTQTEQQRIIAQLDAMIRNLATKPKESKFAQEGGGGGQCNGGPKLPTEAELRLLQDLQRAVNAATEILNAQPEKDKPKLMALGERQGQMRNLLDAMLRKASDGQIKLGPEPDNRDQLPEEAKVEDVENQELDRSLLNDVPDEEKNAAQANLIGDRMGRVRQRLALNHDPGKVTQTIEKRIVDDLDYLIDQAREQQAQTRNPPPGQGQKMAKARPNPGQAQNQSVGPPKQRGTNPAAQSRAPGGADTTADTSRDIRETAAEWGSITPRLRDAVLDSAGENIIEEYRKLVEDYYRSVASKGTGQ